METYQLENYPELENSFVYIKQSRKVSKYIPQAEYEMRKRGASLKRDEIQKLVTAAFEKAQSLEEFYSLVHQIGGAEIYVRGGRNYGIIINNQKYRFSKLLGSSLNEISDNLNHRENSIVNQLLKKAAHRSKDRGRGFSFER